MKYCKSVGSDALWPLPESLTFCATVSETGDEQIVTDMMIRRACEQMEDSQMWPLGPSGNYPAEQARGVKSAVILQFPLSA